DVLKAQDLNDSEKLALVKEFDSVLSLDLEPSEKSEDNNEDLNEEITALIEKRNEARKNKDWTSADAIRDDLKARGIVLIDTPQGVTWKFEN
ncbi:MAG: cysteine--tRNA ligase, partial [bacterium]|nr:cysteine--tRNA ligase [bacterium]